MAKFNAVEKRCNIAVMLLNESKDLKILKIRKMQIELKKSALIRPMK